MQCCLWNYDIFLNEFLAYFGKFQNSIYHTKFSLNMLNIHSKICHKFKINISNRKSIRLLVVQEHLLINNCISCVNHLSTFKLFGLLTIIMNYNHYLEIHNYLWIIKCEKLFGQDICCKGSLKMKYYWHDFSPPLRFDHAPRPISSQKLTFNSWHIFECISSIFWEMS